MANLKTLLKFVVERENIRLKKQAGASPPFTKDKILRDYRFCNIRRSDDRVSSWLIENVLLEKYIQHNLPNFLLFSAWCRWVNWPPTIQKVGEAGISPASTVDWPKLGRFVDKLKGKKWTGAYMIVAPRGSRKPKKGLFVAKTVIERSLKPGLPLLVAQLNQPQVRSETIWEQLTTHAYFGDFMAGQIVADWGYTSLLKNAPDHYTWAPVGPGSKRGFNRLMRRPLRTKIEPGEWKQVIAEVRSAIINELGEQYLDFDAMSVQNCFCEFDKYLRVKNGEGRPRALYHSHAGLY